MFIKLSGIYYNVDKITEFYADGAGWTRVCDSTYATDGYSSVRESPEQILALIEAEKRKALRDEFAGKVLPQAYAESHSGSFDAIAIDAYAMADAMLKAREVK